MRFKKFITEDAAMAAATTKLQEGLHCVAYAIRQVKKKDIIFDDIFDENIFGQAYDKFCNVDVPDSELLTFVGAIDWTDSIVESANAAKKSGFLKKNNYEFHRGSAFMNSIYQQAQILMKKENIKMGNDKWNPSDIWATTINSIPKFDNIVEYNKWISDQLKKGTLVGISLKKVKGKAKVTLVSPSDPPEAVTFKEVQKPRDILPTGVMLMTNKPGLGINFRSFRISKQADITGEIVLKGGGARHGKVPSGVLKSIIKNNNIPQMPKGRIKDSSDSQLVSAVQNLWKQCGYNFNDKQMEDAWMKRKGNIQDRVGYWQSVIHSLELAAYMNTHGGKADDIINQFFMGGSSASEFSSEFIKVY